MPSGGNLGRNILTAAMPVLNSPYFHFTRLYNISYITMILGDLTKNLLPTLLLCLRSLFNFIWRGLMFYSFISSWLRIPYRFEMYVWQCLGMSFYITIHSPLIYSFYSLHIFSFFLPLTIYVFVLSYNEFFISPHLIFFLSHALLILYLIYLFIFNIYIYIYLHIYLNFFFLVVVPLFPFV